MPIVCPKAKIVKCVKIGLDKNDIFGSEESYVEFYVAHNLVYRDWALIVLKLVLLSSCVSEERTVLDDREPKNRPTRVIQYYILILCSDILIVFGK